MDNINNNSNDKGYIPFNLNSINKNYTLDSILILDDGSYFLGRSFGSKKKCLGEICFNTSFSGYCSNRYCFWKFEFTNSFIRKL